MESIAPKDSADAERAPLLSSTKLKNAQDSDEYQQDVPKSITRKLYASHLLSTWNSRVFEFGSVLYLANIFPGTLVPMSLYALSRGLSAVALAPTVGSYIDTVDRLLVVRSSIAFQRLAVAGSCAAFWFLATWPALGVDKKNGLIAFLAALACVEKIFSIMNTVSVEKDWVIVIAGKNQKLLRTMNSQMRRIDLICKILGPMFIASIDGVSTAATVIVMLAMNICSLAIEYYTIALVYRDTPALKESKAKALLAVFESSEDHHSHSNPAHQSDFRGNRLSSHLGAFMKKFKSDFSYYHHHEAFLPSIAIALLSLTVLSFGPQMITYLLSSGYNSTHVAIARTLAVVLEISATWVAPWLMSHLGPVKAGQTLSLWQLTMLLLGTMAFLLAPPGSKISVGGLVIGVILSRIGLRGFELCIQTIVQQEVEAESRGAFSSVEAAYQSLFELSSYASTAVFSRPDQFRWPALISNVAVALASLAYAYYVYNTRRMGVDTQYLTSSTKHKINDESGE